MRLADLTRLADELDATAPEDFARYVGSGTGLQFPIYAPLFELWEAALKEKGLGRRSEYYDRLLSGTAPRLSKTSIAAADLEALVGYATFVVRGERFCDGHIAACHKQGLLASIVRRLAELETL